jgi:hypothetical protein
MGQIYNSAHPYAFMACTETTLSFTKSARNFSLCGLGSHGGDYGEYCLLGVIAGRLVYIFRRFRRNDFGGRFFRNVGIVIPNYTASRS